MEQSKVEAHVSGLLCLQADSYREKLYAGILGKIIGVYLGRPFENWRSEDIQRRLGTIDYYVNDKMNLPLVVTDDDLSGTFTFINALEDSRGDVTAADIGRAWLNYIIEERTTLWWGGRGTSTEHTAWLNLQAGMDAPLSGASRTNGQVVAEQIGAQIFIDGWALVNPGDPARAAVMARKAAQVSHDGAAVDAAALWAAMEAEAFQSADASHLLETGLRYINVNSAITELVRQIEQWVGRTNDWRETLDRVQHHYGYDRYPGGCHVVPNHALMIMTLLHAGTEFDLAQSIVNTSGWDTDCNAGNIGCLIGIARGLSAFEGLHDWRGPIADRCLISSAAGTGMTDAVSLTDRIETIARGRAGLAALPTPKGRAQFHFSLPGSVQGFQLSASALEVAKLHNEAGALRISIGSEGAGQQVVAIRQTFILHDPLYPGGYNLENTPQVNPGQRLFAAVSADLGNHGGVEVCLRVMHYGPLDSLIAIDGPLEALLPGSAADLSWVLPDPGFPIAAIGVAFRSLHSGPASILLDHMGYDGTPKLCLRRPAPRQGETAWRRAFVNAVSAISDHYPESFRVSQNRGTGLLIYGGRDWQDYSVSTHLTPHLCQSAGLAVRVAGLRRYLAARFSPTNGLELVMRRDDSEQVLANLAVSWRFDAEVSLSVEIRGQLLVATLDDQVVTATLPADAPTYGGFALMVTEGSLSADEISVEA